MKRRCEVVKGKRVLLKCSGAIYCKPGFIIRDSVIDTVSMIIIGMIKYRYNRGQRMAFYHQQQGMYNVKVNDKFGLAARESSLAESYKVITESRSLRARWLGI